MASFFLFLKCYPGCRRLGERTFNLLKWEHGGHKTGTILVTSYTDILFSRG